MQYQIFRRLRTQLRCVVSTAFICTRTRLNAPHFLVVKQNPRTKDLQNGFWSCDSSDTITLSMRCKTSWDRPGRVRTCGLWVRQRDGRNTRQRRSHWHYLPISKIKVLLVRHGLKARWRWREPGLIEVVVLSTDIDSMLFLLESTERATYSRVVQAIAKLVDDNATLHLWPCQSQNGRTAREPDISLTN